MVLKIFPKDFSRFSSDFDLSQKKKDPLNSEKEQRFFFTMKQENAFT